MTTIGRFFCFVFPVAYPIIRILVNGTTLQNF